MNQKLVLRVSLSTTSERDGPNYSTSSGTLDSIKNYYIYFLVPRENWSSNDDASENICNSRPISALPSAIPDHGEAKRKSNSFSSLCMVYFNTIRYQQICNNDTARLCKVLPSRVIYLIFFLLFFLRFFSSFSLSCIYCKVMGLSRTYYFLYTNK